jgi:hypothetical protein
MDSNGKIGELISQAKPVFLCCERSPLHHYAPQPQVRLQQLLQGPLPLGSENYSAQILESTLHFRKILKTALVGSEELGRFWVMDTLSCLGSIPPTMLEKLEAVRLAIGPVGVHFTESGKFYMFTSLAKTIIGLPANVLIGNTLCSCPFVS